MKQIILIFLLATEISFGQGINGIKYQAVVRDGAGIILPNQNVSFKLSVIDSLITGNIIYQETHNLPTNQFGLANLIIGQGTVLQGSFININWGHADKFLKVELDVNGGSNYQNLGTSQFLSVPYALYADDINENIKKEIRRNRTLLYLNK